MRHLAQFARAAQNCNLITISTLQIYGATCVRFPSALIHADTDADIYLEKLVFFSQSVSLSVELRVLIPIPINFRPEQLLFCCSSRQSEYLPSTFHIEPVCPSPRQCLRFAVQSLSFSLSPRAQLPRIVLARRARPAQVVFSVRNLPSFIESMYWLTNGLACIVRG